MIRHQQPALLAFVIGLVGLGVTSLIFRDFAMVWQPVPPSLPGRAGLAIASGILLVCGGLALLFEATAATAIRVLFPYVIAWQLLKLPAVVVAPKIEAVWLGFGEITTIVAGGWTLFAVFSGLEDHPFFRRFTGERGIRMARIAFAIALLPIGLSHILYIQPTVSLVPVWLPYRAGWGYATGIAHMACGVAVLLSIVPRLAVYLETAMLAIFALLVWAPKILAAPTQQLPWVAFFITWVIAAAAWVIAQNIGSRSVTQP